MFQPTPARPSASPSLRSQRYWRWGMVLAYAGSIFFLSALPGSSVPSVAISDKVVHAVEFGGLALCLCRALRAQLPTCSSPVVALISVLLTLGYGGVDELHQLFVPGRSTDFADILADGLGAILAAWGWIKGSHYWPWLH